LVLSHRSAALNDADFRLEDLIPLRDAAALVPLVKGEKRRVDAVYRWCEQGLRSVRVGGSRFTTEAWLKQWILESDSARKPHARTQEKAKAKRASKRRDEVNRALDNLGV
jgi:hypothetical protein